MDAAEQIKKFQEFLEGYETQIFSNISKGLNFVVIDFGGLAVFDPSLAEELLNEPEETIKAAEAAIQELDLPEHTKNFRTRFKNLPESQKVKIRDIRSTHLGGFIVLDGLVRQKSDVRPQVVSSRFECPSCGNIISVLQLESRFKEPTRCGCGRKGKFSLLSKELVDAQGIVMEEIPENLEGGEQPKRINVFLKEDLVSPITEKKTNPGSKICVIGQVKEVPIILRTGSQSTKFDLLIEANYVEAIEESFYEMEISKEEEEKIKELAADPRVYEKIIESLAPSIYGHERIKEALILQLLGGVQKKRSDGLVSRGDIHVLLVGDPGCIAADSMVSLCYKGMKPIKQLGKKHLQEIREVVSKIRRNSKEKGYDFATRFHMYRNQPVLKVKTETGKSITCTYNQPFLTKEGWKRADELVLTEKIRVMPSIPNTVKKLKPTNFIQVEKKTGHLKDNIKIPRFFTPELAALCGYIIGDGNIHPNGYRATCYINNQETDLIQEIDRLCVKTFNVNPKIITLSEHREKFIESGNSMLRQIIATQPLHLLEINSKQVAVNLSFLRKKEVPQAIFESPKPVIAEFIGWLFEADGSVFGNGRGRTSIQLKSKDSKLLQGVQLLLLYFGIHSRIIEDNLCIRRSHDMKLFAKHIGFKSIKKIEKIVKVIDSLKNRTMHLRKGLQRYEKVIEVLPAGIIDVFDFEVPKSHMFVANGIVCHNSGKSQLLKRITSIAPKGRYVSGKGVSGAGLTAAVVRDEFLGGWSLEAGALVLASNGICAIDEMDKMSPEDRGAMHEALEQQSYHPSSEIMLSDGSVRKIGCFVDSLMDKNKNSVVRGKDCEILPVDTVEVLSTDFNKIFSAAVSRVSRHCAPEEFIEILYNHGRKILVTPEHPVYVYRENEIKEIPAEQVKISDLAIAPRNLICKKEKCDPLLARLLGYIATEGHIYRHIKNRYAEIGISNTDTKIIDECKSLFEKVFNVKTNMNRQAKERRKRATKDLFTIRCSSMRLYRTFVENFPELINKAPKKRVPNRIKQADTIAQTEFLKAAFKGDGFVDSERFGYSTASYDMAKDYQDLLLMQGIWSYIAEEKRADKKYYKVVVSSTDSLAKFNEGMVENDDRRKRKITFFCERSEHKANYRDPIPTAIVKQVDLLLRKLRLNTGYFKTIIEKNQNSQRNVVLRHLLRIKDKLIESERIVCGTTPREARKAACISVDSIAKSMDISNSMVYYLERNARSKSYKKLLNTSKQEASEKLKRISKELDSLLKLIKSELRFVTVKAVSRIKNKDIKWVYDVTVDPTRTFISEGLVLHNSISISKANIQATLLARTTVLAAANPKFGRFDPYGIIADQINLPPTLINRFDLIFPIKDLPNEPRDEKMARHILSLHQTPDIQEPEVSTELLRKFVAYARRSCKPKLTDRAFNEIKNFYVQMRNRAATEERATHSIPVSPRQLEALVRMAEASAKARLSDKVTKKDARRSIELLTYCLLQVGLDRETGQIDIDRIATGIPASQRDKIFHIKEILTELENKLGKTIPMENVVSAAMESGLTESEVEEVIERLKRMGDIYEPRHGFIQKL